MGIYLAIFETRALRRGAQERSDIDFLRKRGIFYLAGPTQTDRKIGRQYAQHHIETSANHYVAEGTEALALGT